MQRHPHRAGRFACLTYASSQPAIFRGARHYPIYVFSLTRIDRKRAFSAFVFAMSFVDRLLYVACAMLENRTLFDSSVMEKKNAAA